MAPAWGSRGGHAPRSCSSCRRDCTASGGLGRSAVAPTARRYVLLGWTPSPKDVEGTTSPALKLRAVVDARSLRLFVWKLHNAVSASIERSERWYQQVDSITTSRYWPNVQATLYRAASFSGVVSATRVAKTLEVVDCAVRLNQLRESLLDVSTEHADELAATAAPLIAELDATLLASGVLSETYGYNGRVEDAPPDVDYVEKHAGLSRHEHWTLA